MKHQMPTIESLLRTNFTTIEITDENQITEMKKIRITLADDDRLICLKKDQNYYYLHPSCQNDDIESNGLSPKSTVSLFKNKTWSEITPYFKLYPLIFIEDEALTVIGYITSTDLLQALFLSYQYLQAYYDTMLETTDTSITLIDEERKFVVWTLGAEHIFSIKKKDVIGKSATDFFPVEMLETLKTLQTGESVFRRQHQPREDLFVLINTNPVKLNGKIIGAVAAEVDITTQIRLHHELSQMTSKVHHLQKEVAKLNPSLDPFAQILGTSKAIKQTIETIKKISTTKATALILGESGVGKELFAKAIHDSSESENAPFIAINCGAIPPSLFESELFGYEKGAFSGADPKGKKGKIELARGGTLFLDEIGEMPLDMQVKLLRVLQEKKYYSIGGTQIIDAHCRIIAATNRDLSSMASQGKFREDLFYRINVVTMEIPPLRNRKEDIFQLTQAFFYEFSLIYNRYIEKIPHHVMQDLLNYEWPGNIRELRNTIERLVIFTTDGEIKKEYLPSPISSMTKELPLPTTDKVDNSLAFQDQLDEFERDLISKTLELESGNKQATAIRLGISRATLYNKLKRLNML